LQGRCRRSEQRNQALSGHAGRDRATQGAFEMVKVIASNVRKGNVLEHEGGLYVVLKADSFRPGKGTPTTTVEMRRISDGVKTVITVKTGEGLERAFVEEVSHNYLYNDGDNYIFINNENYDQVPVTAAMLGDDAVWLQENAECKLLMFDGKPATMENGARVMVPPHIDVGTRIVINTEDNGYVERAKD
jgi:elongation factor P